MSNFSGAVKDKVKHGFGAIVDLVAPPIDEPEREEETVVKAAPKQQVEKAEEQTGYAEMQTRQVANGGSVSVASAPVYEARTTTRRTYTTHTTSKPSHPQLTVHTTKVPSLSVQIYAPHRFDQVPGIADNLKAGRAAVVNFEQVDEAEQRRICDFLNGVCYVEDGGVKRISDQIILYVPNGVDVTEAVSVAVPE